MRKGLVSIVCMCLITAAGLFFCAPEIIPSSQEIDRFYINLLHKGESSYLSGYYAVAIKQLETAIFGLHADSILHTRALVHLSLAHYFENNTIASENYLRQALDIVGTDGFAAIELTEKAQQEISALLARFKLGAFTPQSGQNRVARKPDPNPDSSTTAAVPEENSPDDGISALESLIESNPSNVDNFYDLHKLYLQNGKRKDARKTLEQLIERHPDEINGYYLLGKMSYVDRKYKEAEQQFQEALRPRPNVMLSDEWIEEIRAYQIIAVYQRGDRDRALDIMAVSVHMYTEAKIRLLPLSGIDKNILREVIREYMKR